MADQSSCLPENASIEPICQICHQPLPLGNCKIDEHGLPVHDACYFQRASPATLSA